MLTIGSIVCEPPAPHKACDPPEGSDVGRKLLPAIVNVNAGPPAVVQLGDKEETVGNGFPGGLMINATGFESPLVPAPECGLRVFTNAVPGLATSDAGTVAVARLPKMLPAVSVAKVVARVWPFHCTTVLATKPAPLTVNVKSELPALIVEGDRERMVPPVGT